MPILSDLSLWQEILLAGLAGLSLVYVFYFKIWIALAAGSDLLFALALGVAVTAVAVPAAFEAGASVLIDRSPLPAALASVDGKMAALESLPGRLIDRAFEKLGYEPDPEDRPPPDEGPGPFEASVRPSVESLLALVLRAAGFFGGTVLLLLALSMRSATSTVRALRDLSKRLDTLEEGPSAQSPAPVTH